MFLRLLQFIIGHAAGIILLTVFSGLFLFLGNNYYAGHNKNDIADVLSEKGFSTKTQKVFTSPTTEPTPKFNVPAQSPSAGFGWDKEPHGTQNQVVSPVPSLLTTTETKSTDLVGEVNIFRSKNGKLDLAQNSIICDFAKERLVELHVNYSHEGFSEMQEKTGKRSGAENIARTSKKMGSHYVVYEMWAKSDGHRENMLEDYTQGCGYYDGKYAILVLAR